MSSAVDIQISNPPNLEKIENFLKDSTYRETIEFSANFNTRLCIERRLRLPFLDPQTGVAQNHSNLFMDKRQRMPGFRQGQIYTYPAARWRKSRRQYLNKMYRFPDRPFQALRKENDVVSLLLPGTASVAASTSSAVTIPLPPSIPVDPDFNGALLEESSSLGGAGDTSDSKDSQPHLKDELPKEWFYDDMDINEMDSLEEPKSPADDEYDYDPRYGNKKRRRKKPVRKSLGTPSESSRKSRSSGAGSSGAGSRGGRGRRKAPKDASNRLLDPPSPGMGTEPPSFETAAAAVGGDIAPDDHVDLRNYRKYL